MIEILAVVLASIAGIWDLKTTEVPDDIPYLMTVIGLVYWFFTGVSSGNMQPFFVSLLTGTVVLFIGLALYAKGKWGGADAWILAAIIYMVPVYAGKLILVDYVVNFLIVSLVYMALYTILLGIKHHIFGKFFAELKKNATLVIGIPLAYMGFSLLFVLYTGFASALQLLTATFVFILLMMLFWVYAKVIEKNVFIRRISTNQLKKGDVLFETKWVGITEKELALLRNKKQFVTIKDGVRFVPVFPITLVVTLVWGNLLFLML